MFGQNTKKWMVILPDGMEVDAKCWVVCFVIEKRSEKRKEMKKYRMRGLNPRPIACEAIVITTTPTRLAC